MSLYPISPPNNPRTPGGNRVFPLRDQRNRRSSQVSRALKAQFRLVDKDRNGMLDEEELSALLRQGSPNMTDEEVHAIFSVIDSDGSGNILFDEFVDFLFIGDGASSSSSSSSSSCSEDEESSSLSSASDSEGEALALAARQARRVSATLPGAGASGEISLLKGFKPEAELVELSGMQELPQLAGVYVRRQEDWLVAASNCINESSAVLLNSRPIYEREEEAKAKAKEKGKGRKAKHYMFYGWTKDWGRWGQAGWFVSDRLPEDQEPVSHYLLFNPSSEAATPDLCAAIWESQKGTRDKCILCEALPSLAVTKRRTRRARTAGHMSNLLADELWEPGPAHLGGSATDEELGWEWRVQPGEDSWLEPEAEPAEEPPPGRSRTPEQSAAGGGRSAADAAAEAARLAAEARRRAAQRLRQGPRRLSDDMSIMQAPGFKVVTKLDERQGWLERSEKKKQEELKRRGSRASTPSIEMDKDASSGNPQDQLAEQQQSEGEEGPHGISDPRLLALIGNTSTVVDGWEKLSQLHQRPCLFIRILPDDVLCEASSGNYWFLCACAAVAEYPAWIQAMFGRAARLSPEGLYNVRLYHPGRELFLHVGVDDGVPTTDGCPAFAGITGEGAIWVALVEKAFAKFCRSYAAIERGMTAFGLLYLCGGQGAESWKRQATGKWRRAYTQWRGKSSGGSINRQRAEGLVDDGVAHSHEDMWEVLRRCMTLCQPVVCGVDSQACTEDCGLVPERPYSLLSARDLPTSTGRLLRMVHLRNAFGPEEWQGRWSNGSEAWGENPSVEKDLEPERADDGAFWMSYIDFLKHFDSIDFVKKSMPMQGCCKARRVVGEARLWAAGRSKPHHRKSAGKG